MNIPFYRQPKIVEVLEQNNLLNEQNGMEGIITSIFQIVNA